MKKMLWGFGILALCILCAWVPVSDRSLERSDSVANVLIRLGDAPSDHKPNTVIAGVSAEVGEDIVKMGYSDRGEKKARRQSKHFVCTSCHNTEREDPDLRLSDPQARLEYTARRSMPFLQGTTLYGAVNRTTFYNGDYEKKYGDLVDAARNDIRAAIQLCATECSQGRKLKDWEMESVLAYLWTIDLKMEDLTFNESEWQSISEALASGNDQNATVDLIRGKYLSGSPAHFVAPPVGDDRKKPTNIVGNAQNGQLIYENSCLHCHYKKRYSYFNLDRSKMTFRYLKRKANGYGRHSIYEVVRYGTSPKFWKKSYMPQYPDEKMSRQQMADLRAYIEEQAK